MTTTTRQYIVTGHATVGNGTAVHAVYLDGAYTVCGAEGRRPGSSRLRATDTAVTCKRCQVLAPAPVEPATRAARTWDATATETHPCAGACGETKLARSFPTTGKDGQRGVECRSCRDARKVAA